MERRAFIKTGALIGAGLLADPWDRLIAQDIRGAAQSGIVKTSSGPVRGIVFDRVGSRTAQRPRVTRASWRRQNRSRGRACASARNTGRARRKLRPV